MLPRTGKARSSHTANAGTTTHWASGVSPIPADAIASFAGVGHRFDLAALAAGETVLGLGSGSGMRRKLCAARRTVRSFDNGLTGGAGGRGYVVRPPTPDMAIDGTVSADNPPLSE
jgi:hypothetical protein